jgi:hypothetical protein
MREQMTSSLMTTFGVLALMNRFERAVAFRATQTRESGKEGSEFARKTVSLSPATDRFTAAAKEVTNLGDVAMMLKFPDEWKVFAPETATVRQVLDGNQPWQPDPQAEVLLLGDSFTNIFSLAPMGWGEGAGLAEHLSLALGLPVDAITRNDAGSFATREMLAKELLRASAKDGPAAEDAALILQQAERCREILKRLSQQPEEGETAFAEVGLKALLEEVVEPHRGFDGRPPLNLYRISNFTLPDSKRNNANRTWNGCL